MDNLLVVNAEFNLSQVSNIIKEAASLDDNERIFAKLAEIQEVKDQIAMVEKTIESAEIEIKGMINARAKELYGPDWQTIKGDGYKISRSYTGAKYEVIDLDAVDRKFIKVKVTVDSDLVADAVKATSELPTGIAINQARGEQIRIALKAAHNA